MPDLCGQRARRGRLFAFDANGELIEAPTPAGDVPSSRRAARPSRGAADFSRGAVPCAERPVPSALLDPLFPERPMPSAAGDVPSAAWDVHAAVRDVLAPAEDVSSLERATRSSRRSIPSAKRSVPSKTGTLHTRTADGVVAGEARYAALAKRSAQTADRLLRRVSRHRAKER